MCEHVRAHIREKIQQARLEIQGLNLKKSGYNGYAGFWYYELKDFLPFVTKRFPELKLYDSFSITDNDAVLKVYNLESDTADSSGEVETFSINLSDEARTSLFTKGNPLQSVGCMSTYLKRYLYMNMLNLVEDDEVDATAGKASGLRDRNAKQTSLEKPAKALDSDTSARSKVPGNPKVESYISKAESIHSPEEMNSFIAGLKDEKLAPAEKQAIWNPFTETAKLQGGNSSMGIMCRGNQLVRRA
jgi:hypothetical protein